MLKKLIRKEYYDRDFPLNDQEFKEFSFVRIDPYWKIRFSCSALGVNIFGDKMTLLKRINIHLFLNEPSKKMTNEPDYFDTDIEVLVKNSNFSSGKYDNISREGIEAQIKKDQKIFEKSSRYIWPWDVVVELTKMNKKLTYSELYKAITHLMRPTMIFYNHFTENETITAIVFLPFTPKSLEYFSPVELYCMNKILEMKVNYDNVLNPTDLYKQKLLDLFYFVEDSDKLHGVTFCQTFTKACNNLATQFCPNGMCKLCCQDLQHRLPCVMHDSYDQFFRYKLRSLYSFEEEMNFDINKTLRLKVRKQLQKIDLEKIFLNYSVNWGKVTTYFHSEIQSIQYIYLEFNDQQKAEMAYKEKISIEMKLENFDVSLQTLNENLLKKAIQFPYPQNVICILKPLTTLEIIEEIPSDEDYINKILSLIECITQLKKQDILIQEDINPITKELDNRHIFLTFPDKSYVDKVYYAQPFFGCLLVHKMIHPIICPFMRYSNEICLICGNSKSKKCIFDLCPECCGRQKNRIFECTCVFNITPKKESINIKNEKNDDIVFYEKTSICLICKENIDDRCSNKMCQICCNSQCKRKFCFSHEESYITKKMKKYPSEIFPRKIIEMVADCNLKVKFELKNGHYDWFRPVFATNIQDPMIAANKELQIVLDNPNLIRGVNTSRFMKNGKIFTFQANEPMGTWISNSEKILESIDRKGESYYDYYFNDSSLNEMEKVWTKNNGNKFKSYTYEEYEQYINSPNLQIRNNFHLMFVGLDKNLSIKELYQEVHNKIKTNVGSIEMKNIMVLDNESIITEILHSQTNETSKTLEENIHSLGRVVCLKLDNILDALAIFSNEIKLELPLNNGKNDQPLIYPSTSLIKFIDEFNPQNPFNNLNTSGVIFSKLNEEIENLNLNIKNLQTKQKNNKVGAILKKSNNNNSSFSKEEPPLTKKIKK